MYVFYLSRAHCILSRGHEILCCAYELLINTNKTKTYTCHLCASVQNGYKDHLFSVQTYQSIVLWPCYYRLIYYEDHLFQFRHINPLYFGLAITGWFTMKTTFFSSDISIHSTLALLLQADLLLRPPLSWLWERSSCPTSFYNFMAKIMNRDLKP